MGMYQPTPWRYVRRPLYVSQVPSYAGSFVTYDGSTVTNRSVFWDEAIQAAVAGLDTGDRAYFTPIATRVGGSETATFTPAEGTGIVTLTGVTVAGDYANTTVRLWDATDGTYSAAYTVIVDATLPEIASVTIDATGLILTVTLTENAAIGAGGSGGVTLAGQYGAITATYDSLSTTDLLFDLSRTAYDDEVLTLNYAQPGAGITDTVGNELATITGQAITNNSTEPFVLPDSTIGSLTRRLTRPLCRRLTRRLTGQ